MLAAVVTAVVVALLARQNSELADLLGAVPAQVRAIPPWTVPLAGALKLGEVALNALAWRTALRAAAPTRPAEYGRVVAALQTGSALTALVPPKFATVGLLAIYRAALPGIAISTLGATRVVQAAAPVVAGFLLFLALLVVDPAPRIAASQAIGALANHAPLAIALLVAVVALATLLARRMGDTLRDDLRIQLLAGGEIFRTPWRYAMLVALPGLLGLACRWGVTATLLLAFAIPVDFRSLALVNFSHGLARGLQLTPGGLGTTQAFDLVALQGIASAEKIVAYSLTQSALLLAFNLLFGAVAALVLLGWTGARRLFHRPEIPSVPAD
ncbi:MAG: flippase-like domain-containing protein [Thermomicrobiales bacterium]|nr:flippase-like domain-containing protein [Thermomicrobiales bacterium]